MKFTLAALALATAVLAQNSTQPSFACIKESQLDQQVPPCARACQQKALHADGCKDYDDVQCHCLATGAISLIIEPCLANSTCSQADLAALENTLNPVCAYFNATHNGDLPQPTCGPQASSSAAPPPNKAQSTVQGQSQGGHATSSPCTTYTSTVYKTVYGAQATGAVNKNNTPTSPPKALFTGAASNAQAYGSGALLAVAGFAAFFL